MWINYPYTSSNPVTVTYTGWESNVPEVPLSFILGWLDYLTGNVTDMGDF
jgi:hypothetical protein